ncbi:MAG: hypothetical protein KDB22_19055 [Planctomycetales bacterium]|nr:hypothetical protein [Planctomycetales bacterium]MCC0025174.1 hypothetical protein [Hyphomicrobiaceae bacterium]
MSASRIAQITPKDLGILEKLLTSDYITGDQIRTAIRKKISTSQLVFASDIPEDVATIGSRIRFSANGLPTEERVLTWTVESYPTGLALHVGTLRGLALLGQAAGASLGIPSDHKIERLDLRAVTYQPEAASRKHPIGSVLSAHLQLKSQLEHNVENRPAGSPYWDDDNDPGPSAA